MSSDLQFKIYEDYLHYFLPDGLLDFFEPVMAEQKTHINPTTKAQVPALHLYFDERDNRTEETQDYSPKGFTEETVLNDFPVRDKKLVLHIRRRRWLRPDGSSCVLDVYPRLVAKGTRFSEEFAGFLKKNLDTTPVTARSLGNTNHVDGDNLERSYKYHLSDYSTWVQKDHAGDWVLVPDNIGEHLCIDKTSLQDDLFTILSNKAGHGRQGTIISMVRGTKACEVIKVLMHKLKEAYDLVHKLRSIFKSKKLTRDAAKVKLHEWYQAIADCSLREVKSARDAIKDREEYVLNYFINRATNAAAESLNSKLKGFRAQVRGVSDLPFFMYRVCQIFG